MAFLSTPWSRPQHRSIFSLHNLQTWYIFLNFMHPVALFQLTQLKKQDFAPTIALLTVCSCPVSSWEQTDQPKTQPARRVTVLTKPPNWDTCAQKHWQHLIRWKNNVSQNLFLLMGFFEKWSYFTTEAQRTKHKNFTSNITGRQQVSWKCL